MAYKTGIAQHWGSPKLAVKPTYKSPLSPGCRIRALPHILGRRISELCVSLPAGSLWGRPSNRKQEENLRLTITKLGTGMFKECFFAVSLCNFIINLKYIQKYLFSSLAKMFRDLGQENAK